MPIKTVTLKQTGHDKSVVRIERTPEPEQAQFADIFDKLTAIWTADYGRGGGRGDDPDAQKMLKREKVATRGGILIPFPLRDRTGGNAKLPG